MSVRGDLEEAIEARARAIADQRAQELLAEIDRLEDLIRRQRNRIEALERNLRAAGGILPYVLRGR